MKTVICALLMLMVLAGCGACDGQSETSASSSSVAKQSTLTVKIRRDGGYLLERDGKSVQADAGTLLGELQKFKVKPNDPVTLTAEKSTPQEHVLQALDTLSDLHLKRVTWDFSVTQ